MIEKNKEKKSSIENVKIFLCIKSRLLLANNDLKHLLS